MNSEFRFALNSHETGGDFADFMNFEVGEKAVNFRSDATKTNITLAEDSFTGTGEFVDLTTDSLDLIPGTFSGSCS